jgi:hypothetical protein
MVAGRASPFARTAFALGVVVWHLLMLWAVTLGRGPPAAPAATEPLMTWLRLDDPPLVDDAVAVPSPQPRQRPREAPPLPEPAATPAPDTAAITLPSASRWYDEAARVAREQVEAAAGPPRPEGVPEPAPPAQPPRHKAGDQISLGGGDWLLYVTDNCTTVISGRAPLPGEFKPMVVHCRNRAQGLDAEALEKRRPAYLNVPQPRAGPSMGGALAPDTQ